MRFFGAGTVNKRNVDALAELLWEMNAGGGFPAMYAEEARWLSQHGVLVPSSLTDEEANSLPKWFGRSPDGAGDDEGTFLAMAQKVRDELERIARGEGA